VTVDWAALQQQAATSYGVSPVVHEADLLWPFIVGHPNFTDPVDAANYYFHDGAESARKLALLVHEYLPAGTPGESVALLEFASGYGMVTRHLTDAMPRVQVTSCDIHQQAVDFVHRQLGGVAVLSRDEPEELELGRTFDVVFALSFFSHMPKSSFGRWLAALYRAVAPGGILAFTTHGLGSRAALGHPEIDEDGFWFKADSEQHDLDTARYGSTLSTPDYVIAELYRQVGAPLAAFRGSYWWGHQDLYVVSGPRSPGP
jgi:SAM-dependent methyltransferase